MNNKQISHYLYSDFLALNPKVDSQKIIEVFSEHLNLAVNLPKISKATLTQVFTHKSFSHEMKQKLPHNERLEFLGDAVLELIVTDKLVKDNLTMNEGELSKFRSSLVNETSLSQLALKLNLGDFILLGKGELRSNGHLKPSILSDTFEALLGGIYLECGASEGQNFFNSCVDYLKDKFDVDFFCPDQVLSFDAKTRLQEMVMQKFKVNPEYNCETLEDSGEFLIRCKIENKTIASSTYSSKKKGMQALAKYILENNLIENHTETSC